MTEAMPFLQKAILLSYAPRSLPPELLIVCRRTAGSDERPQVPIHSQVT